MKTRLLMLCMLVSVNCLIGQTFTNMTGILNNTWGSTPCVADMNGDGLDDVVTLVTSSGRDISIDYQQPDGTFDQVIYDVNAQISPSWSIAAGDLNSDGYLDLMFGGGSRVAFYLSNSTGTAYTEQYINDYIFSQRTNIVDIDGDGDLDAFACHDIDESHPYRNDGTGFMTEDQSLIETIPLAGNYASVWTDFDNDGDTDLYIAKCRQGSSPGAVERENALYVNDGSNNYSGNVIADYGLFDNEQSWVTIFEDFDNDGDMDTYTVNHTAQCFLRENDGSGNYTDVSTGSGLDVSDLGSWALVGADFDNDGWVDMLMESSSGIDKEFYHNNGDMTFTGSPLSFNKGALGDLNNDGYIDVFTGGTLWMNDGGGNNYLKVALIGTNSNINGIGARVECYSDLGIQVRECRAGENFKPMSSLDLFFGLGADTEVDSVIIRWPSGQVDVVQNPAINTRVNVLEGLLPALIRLTHIDPYSQEITIKNFGGEPEDISGYRLCSEFDCTTNLSSLTLVSGDLDLATNEEVTLAWTTGSGFTIAGADMALFLPTGDMNLAENMVDFAQWGSGGNGSENVAVTKGIWGTGEFIPPGLEYSYTGSGDQNGVTFWEENPFCLAPSDGLASNLTPAGADLSWTENGSASFWDLEIGLADFSPNGTPTYTGVGNLYAFSGTEGTVYDFFVRADCEASGGISMSDWAGPFRFTLPVPISECDNAIDVSVGGTFNTGTIDGVFNGFESCMASSPNNANWFVYTAANDGTLNVSSVGLSSVDTQVSIGTGTCGSLTEIACSDDFTGSPPWESEVEFEVTAGTDYYIMWGDGWTTNASDFMVTFTPDENCEAPSNLQVSNITGTGADITWTENGSATYWDLEIGNTGFTPSGAPTNSVNAATNALTGSEGQSFDIYVRADCGSGGGVGYSEWVGPVNVILINTTPGYQWLDFSDETPSRLVVTSVANSDDEEKDIAVADLNNDGFDDVIVCRKEPFSVSTEGAKSDLLLINENGVLTDRTADFAPEFISMETFARDLYIDDFDGDGWKDVIIANTFNQQPQYFANQGDDGEGNWLGLVDESSTRFPTLTGDDILFCAVWGGDIDGDLDQDIYFVNYKQGGGGGVAKDFLLINDGAGVFTDESETRLGNLRNSAFGTSVQIHDMDNDGDQDILKISTLFSVLPWGDNGLFVLFNDGTGSFSNWQNIAPTAPYMFEVADYTGDGLLDVFVVDDNVDFLLTVNSFVPDVSLDVTTTYVVNGLNGFGGNVHAIDLDLDGDLDIAVSDVDVDIPPCNSGRKLALLENQGGIFVDHHTMDNLDWELNSYDLGFIDINGDGLQDFITGGCGGYNVFMSDNCDLVTSSADFDLDGLPDACDECPTNPDPTCAPDVEFPTVGLDGSVARQWNDLLLESIRRDYARPTVHARNLFHTSLGMWDTWAVYNDTACTFLLGQTVDGFECTFDSVPTPDDVSAARDEALSFMAYRLLSHRFSNSPSAGLLQMAYDAHMDSLGYDINEVAQDYVNGNPAALGNYVAQCIINFGLQDGSNEQNGYANLKYAPVNPPMIVQIPGNDPLVDWNRWQPLSLDLFIDQSGNEIPGSTPDFLSPEWGQVSPFALDEADKVTFNRDDFDYEIYHDPGTPPLMDTTGVIDSEDYRWGFMTTLLWSSHLDANDGVMWDISPASIGKRDELPETVADYSDFYDQMNGGTTSPGHAINPSTGQPYAPNMVPRGDYARVLAEFWADGPDSETPPGHWFTLLNYVSDHDSLEKKFMGEGPVLDDLEWDVKSYFMMGGAMHDAAVSSWGIKGWHDYLRPISAIRAMASKGQSTDPGGVSYHPAGVPLIPGQVEVILTGDPLAGDEDEFVGDIKVKAWKGHNAINNVDVDEAGVDWIHASEWEPYQRPSFVTPPFAGYISGHSTFSRAAAEIMKSLTGDAYFPGGIGTFSAEQDDFLVFEDGPSMDIELQWATYQDAADESGLSRIWGGIHPPCDDIPGRKNGIIIGQDVFAKAMTYFNGCQPITPCETSDPIAICQDVIVNLDETGNASLSPTDVDNGSSDECTLQENLILSLDITDFTCDDIELSPITVTLTVTDEAGNSTECTSQITINPGNNCYDCPELLLNIDDACDDADAGTENDVVTAECNCEGTIIFDCPVLSLNVGDPCDDGNAGTENDMVSADCNCEGTIIYDCPGLSLNIDDPCDDGDAETENDTVTADCNCEGTSIYDCPDLSANIGDACNDEDAGTDNDMVTSDCECAGTLIAEASLLTLECGGEIIQITDAIFGSTDGGNATSDTRTIYAFAPDVGNGIPSYTGGAWPYVIISGTLNIDPAISAELTTNENDVLLVNGWPAYQYVGDPSSTDANGTFGPWSYYLSNGDQSQDACPPDCPELSLNIGDACDDGNAGTENDTVTAECNCEGDIIYDCPSLSLNIGDDCDDGDAGTENDMVTADCNCEGTVIYDCPDLSLNIGDDCDDGDTGTENDMVTADCNCEGTIIYDCPDLSLNIGDACDDGNVGTENDIVTAECNCEGTIIYDCPDLSLNIGDVCDDGDAGTENDMVTADCNCEGTIIYDCPDLSLNIGDACDDGNVGTENDMVTADCNCEGTIIYDCPDLSLNIGDACDDGDAGTENDTVSAECTCEGTIIYDCPDLSLNISDACNDGNPNTENDIVNADCECVGEPIFASLTGGADWNSECGDRDMTVAFYELGTSLLVDFINTSMAADGTYSIAEVPIGTYDIYVQVAGNLQKGYFNEVINDGTNNLNLGTFIRGDLNSDNGVNIIDLSVVNAAYGSLDGTPNYNPLADMNCDGGVNIIDVSILNASFGMTGDVPGTP